MIAAPMRLAAVALALTLGCFAAAQTPPDTRMAEAGLKRDAFWRAMDAQDYTTAYEMLASAMQTLATPARFAEIDAQTRASNGAMLERRVMRTTIYDNPPNAPAPGLYIAFDFVARAERADRSCGYIILHQAAPDEPFRVMRTEQSYMDNASAAASDQPPDEAWAQLATSLCPGWQRSWAIQPPV